MAVDRLIRGGAVVNADGVRRADVAIEGASIVAVGPELDETANETIDATGLHVFPGMIDPHVHFNEPGRTDWEGFATGSAALAAGGGTCFFDMPLNSSPPVLDVAAFDAKRAAGEASSYTDFGLWGGLTPVPGNLEAMGDLSLSGVVGFKAFMSDSGIDEFPCVDEDALFAGMQRAAKLKRLVAVHAESQAITQRLTQEIRAARSAEGAQATWADYLASRPAEAEIFAVQRALALAAEAGCDLHIVHVSTPAAVDLIVAARTEAQAHGRRVTAETCGHYLAFCDADLAALGVAGKCAPPLRPSADVDGLWERLANGGLDFVASDHSPAPAALKETPDPFDAWGGIAGVQSTRAVLMTGSSRLAGQGDDGQTLARVAALTSSLVAACFGLGPGASSFRSRKGTIAPGFDADLALVDLSSTATLQREDLLDRHRLSPYVGKTFVGVTRRTILRGETIFRDGKMVGAPRGRLITPGHSSGWSATR